MTWADMVPDLQGSATGVTPVLKTPWCNALGGENSGPDKVRYLGNLSTWRPEKFWYCPNRAIGRFRLECPHGHRGSIMYMCLDCWHRWQKIDFCPKCHEPGHEVHPHQKCRLKLETVA